MSRRSKNSGAGRGGGGGGVADNMGSLDAFMQNESELGKVFDGKSTERSRDVMRAQHKKDSFLNELIHVRLVNELGHLIEEWKIVRSRVSSKKIHALIGRSKLPKTEVEFFYDCNGAPMWMDDLLLKGQSTPNHYTIVPQVKRWPYDIRTTTQYEGQTAFIIKQVPMKSKDEITEVIPETIREWIMCALLEEDPHIAPLKKRCDPVKEVIKQIDKKIKGVAKMKFFDDEGNPLAEDKAEEEREHIYEQFGEDRLQAEKKLKKYEDGVEAHIVWRKTMKMDLSIEDVDENTETSSWRIRIYGHDDATEMENLLIAKDNWGNIRVANGSKDYINYKGEKEYAPPYACRGPLPDGSNPMLPDYTDLAVNIAGARFFRIPHGVGTLKQLDRSTASIADNHYGVYYGRWELGERMGVSFEMDDISVYSGQYIRNHRKGKGRLDYGDGTTIVGNFGYDVQVKNKVSLQFDNPYLNGEPNGVCEILFPDGAMYKGQMKNGRIQGHGEYQSAFGEVMIGNFVDGVLHGKDCYKKNHSGEHYKGAFDFGEIHGKGQYKNERGDTYDGYWDHGMKHGRGAMLYKKLGRYNGYFVNGTRNGKGELEFMLKEKKKKKKVKHSALDDLEAQKKKEHGEDERKEGGDPEDEETVLSNKLKTEFKKVFQGYFMSDAITNGGTVMDMETQIPQVLSRRDRRSLMPVAFVFTHVDKNVKKLARKVEKYNDMEHFIRQEIVFKKMKIFRQQKHFTKKSMYAADKWGGFPQTELDSRNIIRDRRLAKVDDTILQPKTALVPVLQNIPIHKMDHLQNIYEHVVPQEDEGAFDDIKFDFLRAAVSDYEEVIERQRYLKYDLIFKRAEGHFQEKKRQEKANKA